MERKFLENLGITGKDTIDTILDENSMDIGNAKAELGTIRKNLTNANTEIETLKCQVTERDTQLEALKKSTGDVEELRKQIETLQADNKTKDKEYAKEIKQMKIDTAVDKALSSVKAKNNIAVKALLKGLDEAELSEDGTVKGLQEQIDALVKGDDTKFLFDSKEETKFKGAEPGETGREELDEEVDLSKMTYDERNAYLNEHPEVEI